MQYFQILGIIFSSLLIVSVFFLVKARRMREKYSLVWFLLGLFTLAISAFHGLIDRVSAIFGVDYAPSAFFAVLLVCAYLLLLHMSVSISSLRLHNKSLTQELGITKLRLEELEKKIDKERLSSNS
jgi:hypothetical protein